MKKILFVTHTISNGGGAEKVLNTLIDELKEEYLIDVLEWLEDTACPFWERDKNVRHIGSIAYTDRKALSLGKSTLINRLKHKFWVITNTFFPGLMHQLFIKDKYDYEISFNYLYTSAIVNHSSNRNSKKINWIHSSIDDLYEISHKYNIRYILYRFLQHRAFSKSDAIVAISKRTHNSIIHFQPDVKDRLFDIYNGYNFDDIIKQSQAHSVDRSNIFRLISLGRLSNIKNVILQIEAIEILRKRNIEIELLVLGEGEQKEIIEGYASRNHRIKILGFRSDPYPYIASSDGLIITSFSEGFPTIAVEAMALGKPVLSTPVAGTEELINSETGVVVDWNAQSVADGILELMNKKFDSRKIQDHVKGYTKECWAENVKQLLQNLENEQAKS